jgi:hypothetical protein
MIYINDNTSFQQNPTASILSSALQQEIKTISRHIDTLEKRSNNAIEILFKAYPTSQFQFIAQNKPNHSFTQMLF